jgi:uncharacterized protein YbcV (DUF1398 family)
MNGSLILHLKPNIMVTIEQIQDAHRKVKSGADFLKYVQELKLLGVSHYDCFVANGQTKYYNSNGFEVDGRAKYPALKVNDVSSADKLKLAITIHQQGKTDYPTFCIQAAEAGVEKWTTDVIGMNVIYLDKKGERLVVEPIPQ